MSAVMPRHRCDLRRVGSSFLIPVAGALLVAMTAAGCGGGSGVGGSADVGSHETTVVTQPDRDVVGDLDYQEVIDRTVRDLSEFWGREFPRVFGRPHLGDPTVRSFDSGMTDAASVSACTTGFTYEEMPDAFYCPVDNVIAYDGEDFFPDLFREIGPFANALVLAHEWGHAIQRFTSLPESSTSPTILTETQSDCYAGAWAASVASRTGGELTADPGDLADGLVGLVEFRDPVGLVNPLAEEAHGSAFDRVSAFQEGFEGGVDRCARWLTDPPVITETPFQDPLDLAAAAMCRTRTLSTSRRRR